MGDEDDERSSGPGGQTTLDAQRPPEVAALVDLAAAGAPRPEDPATPKLGKAGPAEREGPGPSREEAEGVDPFPPVEITAPSMPSLSAGAGRGDEADPEAPPIPRPASPAEVRAAPESVRGPRAETGLERLARTYVRRV